jgi:nucleotide-binding universal stress UspA family protein
MRQNGPTPTGAGRPNIKHDQHGERNLSGCGRGRAVNGGTGRVPRVVVGISRSRASWWALAWAVGEARRCGARLLLAHVFRPPVAPDAEDYGHGGFGTPRDPYAERMAHGNALIATAIGQAVGWMPGDVAIEQQVICGRPAVELASLAWGGDLLVLGSRHRGWLRRLAPGSVARACARRARCPVVIVPEPLPRALTASLPADLTDGHRFRWVPHRGEQTAS